VTRVAWALLFSLTLIATPLAAEAPAAKVWRIGYLSGASRERVAHLVGALEGGLRNLGYVEGRTVVYEHRFADGRLERIPHLAAEMVSLRLDVIVAAYPQVEALKRATTTIPIVMVYVTNPVGRGLVASLARPGGNITGLSSDATVEQWGKRLELLREMVPRVSRVGALWSPAFPGRAAELQLTEAAARGLNLIVQPVPVRDAGDIEPAFGVIAREHVDALIVVADGSFIYDRRGLIAGLAAKQRLPAIYSNRDYVEAGGAEIFVDDHDLLPPQGTGVSGEVVLPTAAFVVMADLVDGRLADVDQRGAGEVLGADLLATRHRPSPASTRRRGGGAGRAARGAGRGRRGGAPPSCRFALRIAPGLLVPASILLRADQVLE